MKRLDRVGEKERAVIEERRRSGYGVARLERYGGELEPHLRALLSHLLPGVPDAIDLVGFVDAHAADTFGRGDRRPGEPPASELLRQGLEALAARRFASASEDERETLIRRLRRGEADEELGLPAKTFVDRLLVTALAGYLAHPDTWERIGFNGPAFPEGYAWIGAAEASRRHEGFPGAARL